MILRKWLQLCVLNLFLVAAAGVIMRYKIIFPLSFIDQKNLLHGHSHFAFAGWITQALMCLLVNYLSNCGMQQAFKKYNWLFYANVFTAYGMFISFPIQGYGPVAILFSTLSVLVSYAFAFIYWKDLNKLQKKTVTHFWFKAAISFNAISSAGAFYLAWMLATKNFNEHFYLASVYFFLHFQYNGWFFFACMGLLTALLLQYNHLLEKKLKTIFLLFFIAAVPAYFLSALWLPIPLWLYILIIIAVLLQITGWVQLLNILFKFINAQAKSFFKTVMLLWIVAVSIKLLLQAFSVIPSLSTLAYGFRPIVIGYLHLVLLGIITLFILNYCFFTDAFSLTKKAKAAFIIFIAGIILNELLLMIQGVADLQYYAIPYLNHLLLAAAIIMFIGILNLFFSIYEAAHKTTAISKSTL